MTEAFDGCEIDIFHDLAEHISLAIDNVSLYEENKELLLAEERSRLARDLHDSVNPKLFSLSLVVQGLRARVGQEDKALVEPGLQEIERAGPRSFVRDEIGAIRFASSCQ